MANIRDIASQSGVSIATVSRVLNNSANVSAHVRRRVLDVVEKHNYVARVGKRSTSNIAYLFTAQQSLYSPYDSQIMAGMNVVMDAYPFDLLVLHAVRSRRSRESLLQLFMRKGVRGAVVRTTSESRHLLRPLMDEGLPAIVVGDRFEDPRIHCIDAASRVASRDAVQHLIRLGHSRIAIAANPIADTDHEDRLAGWQGAMQEAKLSTDGLRFECWAHLEGGRDLLDQLCSLPADKRPTAIYMADPDPSIGLIQQASERGVRIPEDLSVVGFDDANLRLMTTPKMAAVHQSAFDIGRAAAMKLVEALDLEPTQDPQPSNGSFVEARNLSELPTFARYEPGRTTSAPGQPFKAEAALVTTLDVSDSANEANQNASADSPHPVYS